MLRLLNPVARPLLQELVSEFAGDIEISAVSVSVQPPLLPQKNASPSRVCTLAVTFACAVPLLDMRCTSSVPGNAVVFVQQFLLMFELMYAYVWLQLGLKYPEPKAMLVSSIDSPTVDSVVLIIVSYTVCATPASYPS